MGAPTGEDYFAGTFTGGTKTNGHTPDPTEIDRRQLQIEAAYVTHDGLKYIQPPQPLIKNWLYQNSLAWLSGKPGDGKSFIAIDIAYSVATGTPWQGHDVQQGTVLYIAAEGATGLSIRANAWMEANQPHQHPDIIYLPLTVNLTTPEQTDTQALAQALKELQPTLVIIDTQARVTVGAEENSSKDMGRFVDAIETLRTNNPATYLIVHHTPRNGDNLRGSTALEGAADTVLHSLKEGELLTLTCKKQKNAPEAPQLVMALTPTGESATCTTNLVSHIDSSTPGQDQLVRLMWDTYEADEVSRTDLYEVSGMKKATFDRAITPLVRRGIIHRDKKGRSTYYRLMSQP